MITRRPQPLGSDGNSWALLLVVFVACLLAPSSAKTTKPPNFLRWRSLEGVRERRKLNLTISNDFGPNTGTFVAFSSFGLRIGPVSLPTNFDSNGLPLKKEMEGLRFAIEAHLNETLKDVEPPLISKSSVNNGMIGGKFAGFAKVDEVKFVRVVDGEGELVRRGRRGLHDEEHNDHPLGDHTPQSNRQLDSQSSMEVYVTGGRAFYLYGPGGMFMTSIPTSQDLQGIVSANVQKESVGEDGTLKQGGMLAGTISGMTLTNDAEDDFGDMAMFENVESVSLVEGMTPPIPIEVAEVPVSTPEEPGAVPIEPLPVEDIELDTSTNAGADNDATTAAEDTADATEETTGEKEGEAATGTTGVEEALGDIEGSKDAFDDNNSPVGGDPQTSTSAGTEEGRGNIVNGDTEGGNAGMEGEKESNQAVLGASSTNPNLDVKDDSGKNSSLGFIVGGVVLAVLALLAGAALFVYRKRRQHDEEESDAGSNGMKQVPMTQLSDDDYYDDMYGGFYRAGTPSHDGSGGIDAGSRKSGQVEDVESQGDASQGDVGEVFASDGADGKGSALQIVTPTRVVQPDENSHYADSEDVQDQAYEKMIANAAAMGATGSELAGSKREDPDQSLVPQLDENDTSRSIESEAGMDEARAVTKARSLSSHDSLHMTRAASSHDILADLGNTTNSPTENIVYDDIEEAMQLAEAVKLANRIDTKEKLASRLEWPNDTHAGDALGPQDILNNINEAIERELSLESREKARILPNTFSDDASDRAESHIDLLEDEHSVDRSHINLLEEEEEPLPQQTAEDDDIDASHDILQAINQVAKSRSMTTSPSPVLVMDSYVPMDQPSHRSNTVSPPSPSPADPPGDVSLVSGNEVARTDLFSGTRTAEGDDVFSQLDNSHEAARCSNTILQQAKDMLPKRSFMCRQGQNDDYAGDGDWPVSALPNLNTTIVSDDEYEDNDDNQNVARPWNEKWSDPFASKQGNGTNSTLRTVSPTFKASNDSDLEGSNYDPDSDWDVDDTEVDFGSPEEEFGASKARGNGPLRIW